MLAKIFIKNSQDIKSPVVRKAYGLLCSILGIVINLILFAFKLIAGTLSGSIAITADAFNNLSDAGSSLITLFGFVLANHKADEDHPFGHGRYEYISGLFVSMLILLMGFELLKSSIEKIITPESMVTSPLVFIILGASILAKLYMCFYNRSVGKRLDSAAMRATSLDSLSDAVSTTVVLISAVISKVFGVNIDAYCGVLVSLFIFYSGINAAKDTISPLLGQPPKKEFADELCSLVLSYEPVCGIHDLIVHDYGPTRKMLSLHVEVPADGDILQMHDVIDNIEHDIAIKYDCVATIHMDPIATSDEQTNLLKDQLTSIVTNIDPVLSIHDFRMVVGPTHTNLIFDVVAPHRFRLTDRELKAEIANRVTAFNPIYKTVIDVDKAYLS